MNAIADGADKIYADDAFLAQRRYEFSGRRIRLAVRTAITAAAVLAVLFFGGVLTPTETAMPVLQPQAAWASAVQGVEGFGNIHFRLTTPGRTGAAFAVEGWWRRPHDFRLIFGDKLVMTGNAAKRCRYDLQSHQLRMEAPDAPGVELAILGELGPLFGEQSLSGNFIADSRVIASETVTYKGEACLKITVVRLERRFEYIISRLEKDSAKPLVYQVEIYHNVPDSPLLERVEVLGVDIDMPESLFEVTPESGMTVIETPNRVQITPAQATMIAGLF